MKNIILHALSVLLKYYPSGTIGRTTIITMKNICITLPFILYTLCAFNNLNNNPVYIVKPVNIAISWI